MVWIIIKLDPMKKLIFIGLLFLLIISPLFFKMLFYREEKTVKQETVSETLVSETKEETVVEEKKEEEKTKEAETKGEARYQEDVYKMLDFDRRLILRIGVQDESLCSIFNLAYARAILDNDERVDPYDFYDGEGAVWRWADFEDIALDLPLEKVLQKAYDEINAGRPSIFYVHDLYAYAASEEKGERTSYEHFVLLLGYRMNADYDHLKPSDFYAADPSAGYCCGMNYMPWVTLSDEGPYQVNGEYALYAPSDKESHVKTCLAYTDSCHWDAERREVINPIYYNLAQ